LKKEAADCLTKIRHIYTTLIHADFLLFVRRFAGICFLSLTMGGELLKQERWAGNPTPLLWKEGLPEGRGGISIPVIGCYLFTTTPAPPPWRRGVATVRIRTQKQNSYGNLRHGFLDEPSGEAERTLLFIKRHSCWYLRKPCPYKRRPR